MIMPKIAVGNNTQMTNAVNRQSDAADLHVNTAKGNNRAIRIDEGIFLASKVIELNIP